MRIWHDWTSEEKDLFTMFHRDFDSSLCSVEQLSQLKALIDVRIYHQPLASHEVLNAKNIMHAVKVGVRTENLMQTNGHV